MSSSNINKARTQLSSLGVPSNRRQAELLFNGIKETSEKISSNKSIKEAERIDQLITAYKFVILEINRQISIECIERGNILNQIIDVYINLILR